MRASTDGLADDHGGVRASDAERDLAIGQLRDRFAEGLLSEQTFLYRMDAALRAKDRSDLVELFTDLPVPVRRRSLGRRIADRLTSRTRAPAAGTLAGPQVVPAGVRISRRQARRLTAALQPGMVQLALPPLWLPPQEDRRFTIGRAMACDFTLADLSVSRWHARLYRKDEEWLLSDLGSTNGTRLNGWRVTTGVPVRPGDMVTFGSVSFVLTDRAAAAGPQGTA